MSNIHEYSTQEVLNLVYEDGTLNIHEYSTQEVLNLVYDTSNQALKVKIAGHALTNKNTTNATVTTIDTVPIPLNGAGLIEAKVVAIKDDFAQKGGFKVMAIYANNAGTVTLQGSVVYLHSQAQAGWEVTLVISSTNVLIRVKGATATNVSWKCSRITLEV